MNVFCASVDPPHAAQLTACAVLSLHLPHCVTAPERSEFKSHQKSVRVTHTRQRSAEPRSREAEESRWRRAWHQPETLAAEHGLD